MTVKTTLSFTDRHHRFLAETVEEHVLATQSASVAAALEQRMRGDGARQLALAAMTGELRAHLDTRRADHVSAGRSPVPGEAPKPDAETASAVAPFSLRHRQAGTGVSASNHLHVAPPKARAGSSIRC